MPFERNTPEQQGVNSTTISKFFDSVKENNCNLHSFILLKKGKLLTQAWWKPYASNIKHVLFSLSKSFTSTAIGFAVEEKLLSVDDYIINFFDEETSTIENLDPGYKKMKIKHLLTMSTGQEKEPPIFDNRTGGIARDFFKVAIAHEPGSVFMYNTAGTYMLSVILQKVSGQTLTDYLTPRLFQPLEITELYWDKCADGYDFGGFGLSMLTEDIAKFGQLLLQNGEWNGKQVIPASWVKSMTTFQMDNGNQGSPDWKQGYGYQFWMCRNDAFRGDGMFGQYCIALPKQECVIAITSGLIGEGNKIQKVLDIIWDILLPDLNNTQPLPDNIEAFNELNRKIDNLSYFNDFPANPVYFDYSKINSRHFTCQSKNPLGITSLTINEHLFEFTQKSYIVEETFKIKAGSELTESTADITFLGKIKYAAKCAPINERSLRIKAIFYETPFMLSMTISFADDFSKASIHFDEFFECYNFDAEFV